LEDFIERSAIVSKRVQEGWARDLPKAVQVMVPAEARKVFQEL
jgi:hypothetical protein